MGSRTGWLRWSIATLGLAALGFAGASPAAAAHSSADPLYGWNDTYCSLDTCPGSLRFFFDVAARQIHDIGGLSPGEAVCRAGDNTAYYNGQSFRLLRDLPVGADGSFSYHGPWDAFPLAPQTTPGVLDLEGKLNPDGTATGTFHVSETNTTSFGITCPVDGPVTTFNATGPPVAPPAPPSPQNSAPVANADRVPAKDWGGAIEVLANDTDADGDALSVIRVEKMKCGHMEIGPDAQTVSFVPPLAGCPRIQRGVYVASDGKAESNRASFFTPVVRPHLAHGPGSRSATKAKAKGCDEGEVARSGDVLLYVKHKKKQVAAWTITFHWCTAKDSKGKWQVTSKGRWSESLGPGHDKHVQYNHPTEVSRKRGYSDTVYVSLRWNKRLVPSFLEGQNSFLFSVDYSGSSGEVYADPISRTLDGPDGVTGALDI